MSASWFLLPVQFTLGTRETLQATSLRKLETEHVAGLYEELAAIVEEAGAGVGHVSGNTWGGARYVEILQVAVIADVYRCARVHEVSDEEVGIEFL